MNIDKDRIISEILCDIGFVLLLCLFTLLASLLSI